VERMSVRRRGSSSSFETVIGPEEVIE